ncbi:MAG: hypothetical protein AB1656_22755 [Candidatus Omnitrophota bacterium]
MPTVNALVKLYSSIPHSRRDRGRWIFSCVLRGMLFIAPLFLLSCAGFGPPADQEELVSAKIYAGFDPDLPFRRDETWLPLRVELTNNVDPMKGELLIQLKDGDVIYRMPVDLPTKTPKIYDLCVFIEQTLNELEFSILTSRMQIPLALVTVSAVYSETDRVVAVMSAERGTHDSLAHRPELDVDRFRRVVYTAPAYLPRYWIAYRNIDALLWDGGPDAALNSVQQKALEEWIQMGGTLILAAGENWQRLGDSAFKLFVPITMTGSKVLEAGTPLQVKDGAVHPVLKTKSIAAEGDLIDDPQIEVFIEADGSPLLVERKWGAGRIVFSAVSLVNPIFDDEAQREVFADFLTEPLPAITSKVIGNIEPDIGGFLKWAFQAELPSTWFIALYLGCYILLVVPINYFVFKKIGRLEWAWLTVPVWAVLFAVGVYYIGALRQQSRIAVNEIGVVETYPGASVAPSYAFSSIYSPVRQWYSLAFDHPIAFPQNPNYSSMQFPAESKTSGDSLHILYDENGPNVEDFLIYHWSSRQIKTTQTAEIGQGVTANLEWDGSRVLGIITNRTGAVLRRPALFTKNNFFSFADLADGESIDVEKAGGGMNFLPQNELANRNMIYAVQRRGYSPNQSISFDRFLNDQLKRFYAASFFEFYPTEPFAVLAAEMGRSIFPFKINEDEIVPQGDSLLCVILPLSSKSHGIVEVPSSSWQILAAPWSRTWRQASNQLRPIPSGDFQSQISIENNAEKEWHMVAPIPMKDAKIRSLNIAANYRQMFFGNVLPGNARYGMGGVPINIGQPPRGDGFSRIFEKGKNSPPLENQLQIKNRLTGQYEWLSKASDLNGWIKNPFVYVDKNTGKIGFKMKTGSDWGVTVHQGSIGINLSLEFGSQKAARFLGRLLDDGGESHENEIQW